MSTILFPGPWRITDRLTVILKGDEQKHSDLFFPQDISENMAMGQNRGTLVNIKIDGKWMFIQPNMVP